MKILAVLFLSLGVLSAQDVGRFQIVPARVMAGWKPADVVFKVDTVTGDSWIYYSKIPVNGDTNDLESGWIPLSNFVTSKTEPLDLLPSTNTVSKVVSTNTP